MNNRIYEFLFQLIRSHKSSVQEFKDISRNHNDVNPSRGMEKQAHREGSTGVFWRGDKGTPRVAECETRRIVWIMAIIRNSGLSLGRQGWFRGSNSTAAVRRNSNIRTITIKTGGAGPMLSRRWRKSGGTSLTDWAPLGRTQRMQETSSRGVFLKPSPTYGLLPVYAIGSSGRQRNERTDVPSAIFPKTGTNKVSSAASGHPATSFPLREIRSLGV